MSQHGIEQSRFVHCCTAPSALAAACITRRGGGIAVRRVLGVCEAEERQRLAKPLHGTRGNETRGGAGCRASERCKDLSRSAAANAANITA